MVLVCPAILWTLMFFVVFMATLVLHLADVVAFCCLICVVDVITTRLVL